MVTALWTTAGPLRPARPVLELTGVEAMPKPLDGRIPVLNAGS